MKKAFNTFRIWLKSLFSDEKGAASSKRVIGIICALTLCITLYYSVFTSSSSSPSDSLIDAVALLAFGCLGLTSIDKFTAAKNGKSDTPPED